MKQLTPIEMKDVGGSGMGRDHARGGFSLAQLEALVRDSDQQPEWRDRADLSVAYYDGKQLTEEQKLQCIVDGLEPRATNLIGRVINGVLGQEAKSRSDVRLEADSDAVSAVVDALNPVFKEAQRETYADMAVSTGYGSQVKAGLGWVEVSRDSDPLAYPYRVRDVHRNCMWYDWRAKDFLLRDARWVARKEWHDLDELIAAMPEHEAVLRMMSNSWDGWAQGLMFDDRDYGSLDSMSRAFDDFRRFRVRMQDWFDSARKRIKLYEIWYKVPAIGVVLKVSPTRWALYDENNPLHVMAVARGLVKVERRKTTQIRKAIYAGPYRLSDEPTTKRNFPYVPFFAFRDDEDGSPYGLIEGMRSPQDEYNERRLRIQWLLKARQVLVDNDALDLSVNNWDDLANNVMRPDLLLVLNAARVNKTAGAVRIESNLALQKEQAEVMQDAKQLIQDVPGVYSSQLGNAPSGVTSGVALSGLVEQGIIAMGELNDNYKHSRRMVYENLMDLIIEDHDQADLQMIVGEGSSKRVVVLNTKGPDDMPMNVVKDAQVRVGLSDVPSSPAARAQEAQQLAQVIASLENPQAAMVLAPALIELSSLNSETRRQAVEDLRKLAGLPPAGDKAARDAADKAQAEKAAQAEALALEAQKASTDEVHAKVAKLTTDAELNVAKAGQIKAQTEQIDAGEASPEKARASHIEGALAEAEAQ